MDELKLVYEYLSHKKKRIKISQGSILGPLLFNVNLCDLFYFHEIVHCKLYGWYNIYCKKNKEFVINALETSPVLLFQCFNINFMKVNSGKSNLLLTGWLRAFNIKNPAFIPIFHTFSQPFCPKKDTIFQPRQENAYYFPAKKYNIFVTQQEVKPK